MAVTLGSGMLRGGQLWFWLAALAARNASTSYSSTGAQMNRPPPSASPRQLVLQQLPRRASLLPWRRAWRLPQPSRFRTRAAAPAWVTAPLEEQCRNLMCCGRGCVCVCVEDRTCHFALILSRTFCGTVVARCCTPEVLKTVCVYQEWNHTLLTAQVTTLYVSHDLTKTKRETVQTLST